jgi:hypothetical protein
MGAFVGGGDTGLDGKFGDFPLTINDLPFNTTDLLLSGTVALTTGFGFAATLPLVTGFGLTTTLDLAAGLGFAATLALTTGLALFGTLALTGDFGATLVGFLAGFEVATVFLAALAVGFFLEVII